MEWQPRSQGSLLPVVGTRLSGVGVRATEGVPLPALLDSPQLLHVFWNSTRRLLKQKEENTCNAGLIVLAYEVFSGFIAHPLSLKQMSTRLARSAPDQ